MRDPMTSELAQDANAHWQQRLVSHHGKTHLDLFSGIGGFAIAAASAGFKTIGFSEIEPYACKVLKQNWPDVPNYGDIRNICGVKADIITGGFPCQPFSSLGSRGGKSDDRYLWPEMLRVISESGCEWVCAENVPRIIGVALDDVLDGLECAGYSAWAANIPACAVDAPHYRPRIWVVAHREVGRINGVVGECESQTGTDACGRRHTDRRPDGADSTGANADWPAWNGGARICRVADGVSHRIHALGNAIVPQVASEILKNLVMANSANSCPRNHKDNTK